MEEHPQARYIVETLAKAGFVAYYAGGWVRDFLLQHPSDDIDIATNAPPETIQALFPKTVPIGIAFGIVLVIVEGHQYEVATFRQDMDYEDGRRPTRIEFTTAEEDAKRRDFTINGMFYDPLHEKVLDFVGGKKDLELRIIRAIGNPHQRIKEDRLRMIRAVRLSCRFGFKIDPATIDAIRAHASELFPAVAIERIVQELEKGHAFNKLKPMLIQLHDFGLLSSIFPALSQVPISEIEKRLSDIDHYPKNAPLIASLLPLFPHANLEEQLQLATLLKLPSVDLQFVSFLHKAKQMRQADLYDWAHFYANRFADIAIAILKDKNGEHKKRKELLAQSIDRIQRRNPVIRSEDLISLGIGPGKQLGALLKEAEKISINEQLFDKQSIINRLKETSFWVSSN